MRKVRDYYFQKAKKDRYPARSIYKLEEVQKKYRLLRPGDSVLDLGCHPGSWSLYASEVVGPKGVVVGIDLQETTIEARPGGAAIHWFCGDIADPEQISRIRRIRPAFKVLLSDIAPRTTGNRWTDHQQSMRLAEQTLYLAGQLLHEKGHYLCKLFQGEDTVSFIAALKEQFSLVKVIKPNSSRKESRELFVLGMEYRKTADPQQR
ncbi:MAG: RlmE family RNA methyltransferase [Desulfofustis sp.]|nr:RlmE family RNA methyltransferase [Desulfofustis sp.]